MIATWLPPEVVAAAASGDHPERLASCGRASYSVRVEIMDDDGNILPDGEVGEIVARGGLVGGGYFEMPEATAEAWAHGWHHTGDVGRRDADGFFYIVDRKKDMIVTGGFNVFSAEVEAAVMELPEVRECAVIGVAHEKWGEAVTAIVALNAGRQPLGRGCRRSLQGADRRGEGAEDRLFPRRDPAHARRQIRQEGDPGGVLDRRRAERQLNAL